MKATDLNTFIADLDAGTVKDMLERLLSDVSSGSLNSGKVGEITLKLKLKPIPKTHQVMVSHDVSYSLPHSTGVQKDNSTIETPFYVTEKGLSLFYEDPTKQMFNREEAPVVPFSQKNS